MTLTPRDKRMLQVLGVVAGLALIYVLFTNVLGGDDGGDVATPTGPTGGVVSPSGSPTVTPSPTPRETLPPVDLAARDPFSIPPGLATGTPSGSVSPTGTATTTTPPPTGTSTTPPPTFTTPPPTGTFTPPPTGTPPPTPPPTDEITIGGHDLRLTSIAANGKKLQIEVDGKLWTVEEGALFAENFKLVNIKGKCARFLFGDQSFTLCDP
ncbi:MAG TPA: hypothetical protein VID69_08810 [Actinomycetota bacterium]|jgi:hypothetical protein